MQTQAPDAPEPRKSKLESEFGWLRDITENRKVLLGVLFLATAALGLPLLWMSRAFSPWAKVVWSIVVIIYTAIILWIFVVVMTWSYNRIMDAWPQ